MAGSGGLTIDSVARLVGGRLERGDAQAAIGGIAPLAEATGEELSWCSSERYLRALERTRAACVLLQDGLASVGSAAIIRVPDVDLALTRVLTQIEPPKEAFAAGVDPAARVHPSASVDGAQVGPWVHVGEGSRVGVGTRLLAGAYVGAEVSIGRDCTIWPGVVIRERTEIGDRVILHPNVTIGADGFGYLQREGRHVKIPQVGRVVIEDDVEIGANSTVDRARSGATRIGRGTKIDNLVQVGHNCVIGENCVIVALTGIGGSSVLNRNVMVAGHVGIADHARIGEGSMIAAMSGVSGHVPQGVVYHGNPAVENQRYLRGLMAIRRLPRLAEQVMALVRRVERLEASANDSERS